MNLEIISFNGTDLNSATLKAYFPAPSVMAGPEGDAGFVERSYFSPVYTYKRRKPRTLPIHIKMLGTIASNVDTLKALFNPYANDEYKLLVKDLNDSSKQYYVYGTPISIPDVDGQEMVVNLWVADPVWKTETETSVSWAVTGTGDQESITVGGSFYSEPTFEITPTSAKSGGKAYRIFCPVYNPSTITYTDYPVDIVNNALDTAALVADSTRHVTINDGDGITDADATITYDGEVGTFPSSGLAYLETEQISYTGKTATELTGCTRGVNGTSAAAHADDVVIYASKMEADGGDIHVYADGVDANFWLQDINNATTQMWVNLDLAATGYGMTNGVLIANSGAITTITLENSAANIDAINALPGNGRLMIDSELFSYTGKNVTTRQFTGVTREAFGTTAAEHTVGDYVRWIEHEIYIYHGVHDLPAFTVDDDYKPYIELDSTNATWKWDATFAQTDEIGDFVLARTASWRQDVPSSWNTAYAYSAIPPYIKNYYESMSTTVPGSQTGLTDKTFSVIGQYAPGNTYDASLSNWSVYIPAGFTHVAASGKKWQSSAAGSDWFRTGAGYYAFRVSAGGTVFSDAFSVAAPSLMDTIETWSQASLDLSGTFYYGVYTPSRANTAYDWEARQELDVYTVTLNSSNCPVASAGNSNEYYHINAKLINSTTAESIDVDYYCDLNGTLVINTSSHIVLNNDSGAYARGAIALSTYRHDWLKMTPGANVLQWDETGAAGLTIVVKRRERKL